MAVKLENCFLGWAVAIFTMAPVLPGAMDGAEASPFMPQPAEAASDPTPDALDVFEFAGFVRMSGHLQVCLVDRRSQRGQWLSVGSPSDGLEVEAFDEARLAVQVRAGMQSRWLTLRGGSVTAVPVVYRADRSIDWAHMKLTDREKEVKAAAQLWDLMEISRRLRSPEGDAATPARIDKTISPVR